MALRHVTSNAFRVRDAFYNIRHLDSWRAVCVTYEQRKSVSVSAAVTGRGFYNSTFTAASKTGDGSSNDNSKDRKPVGERKSSRAAGAGSASSSGTGNDGGDKDRLTCPKCGETCIHVETFVCKLHFYLFHCVAICGFR